MKTVNSQFQQLKSASSVLRLTVIVVLYSLSLMQNMLP